MADEYVMKSLNDWLYVLNKAFLRLLVHLVSNKAISEEQGKDILNILYEKNEAE